MDPQRHFVVGCWVLRSSSSSTSVDALYVAIWGFLDPDVPGVNQARGLATLWLNIPCRSSSNRLVCASRRNLDTVGARCIVAYGWCGSWVPWHLVGGGGGVVVA